MNKPKWLIYNLQLQVEASEAPEKTRSQVGDPSFPHGGGDGLHRGADGVEQRGQLARPLGLPALAQDEPVEGHYVGVEGRLVGHVVVGRRSVVVAALVLI